MVFSVVVPLEDITKNSYLELSLSECLQQGAAFVLAAIQGFEPRQAESEAAVLPLHYIAIPRLHIKPLYYTTFRKFVKGDKC